MYIAYENFFWDRGYDGAVKVVKNAFPVSLCINIPPMNGFVKYLIAIINS